MRNIVFGCSGLRAIIFLILRHRVGRPPRLRHARQQDMMSSHGFRFCFSVGDCGSGWTGRSRRQAVSPRHDVVYAAPPAAASDACVELLRSEPFQPDESPMPKYPDAAKEKHIEGDVSFHLEVGSGCEPDEITIDDGPEMLREPVEHAVKDWKFCQVPEGQEIRATIAFRLNCPAK